MVIKLEQTLKTTPMRAQRLASTLALRSQKSLLQSTKYLLSRAEASLLNATCQTVSHRLAMVAQLQQAVRQALALKVQIE